MAPNTRLGREREDRDVGRIGGLSFGVAADETDKGDSIEVYVSPCSARFSGTGKRVGVAPKTRSCFPGHTEREKKEKPFFRLDHESRRLVNHQKANLTPS